MKQKINDLFANEVTGGVLLLLTALLALTMANSSYAQYYLHFIETNIGFNFGELSIGMSLEAWINDLFMAIFFIVVGMEVKKEIIEGSLNNLKSVALPAVAAFGGMIIPALIYFAINFNHPELVRGTSIPMATDIAFTVGVIALLGKRVPTELKVFVLALAIIDDLGAIVIIALFLTAKLNMAALFGALVCVVVLFVMNRANVLKVRYYLLVGIVLWVFVLNSGVHATIAGVILGFSIPLKGKHKTKVKGKKTIVQYVSPLKKVEHALSPWVSYAILPIFAFANAGVNLGGIVFNDIISPLPLGIILGLFIGKPLGIFAFCVAAIRLNFAKLPENSTYLQVMAVSILCGIGFTMSIFLSTLSFVGSDYPNVITLSRLGILLGSLLSAVVGYFALKLVTKAVDDDEDDDEDEDEELFLPNLK